MIKYSTVEKELPSTVLKWYEYDQNNSGGSFHVNEKVTRRLYIEAFSEAEANSVAEELGVYFNGCDSGRDCNCCGDRWYSPDVLEFPTKIYGSFRSKSKVEGEATTIEEYAQWQANEWGWGCDPEGYIYYADGRKGSVSKDT